MITQPHLILASASPRRTELLQQIGIPHEVVPANVVEEAPYPMTPHEYVRHLSQKKARAITADGVILAADTVVAIDDMILEKPADISEARAMLARLSGRAHEVVTGVTIRFGEKEETFDVTTHVRFGALPTSGWKAISRRTSPMIKRVAMASKRWVVCSSRRSRAITIMSSDCRSTRSQNVSRPLKSSRCLRNSETERSDAVIEWPKDMVQLKGLAQATTVELLACLVRSGTRDRTPLEIAEELLHIYPSLIELEAAGVGGLEKAPGSGRRRHYKSWLD